MVIILAVGKPQGTSPLTIPSFFSAANDRLLIPYRFVIVAAFAVLGFLGFLGSICCGLSTEIKNQANNQSNILNTSSNTGETPNPPAPSIPKVRLPSRSYQYSSNDIEPQVCDSPPGYLNGIQE